MSEPDVNTTTAEHPRAVPDAEAVENLILRHAVASAGFGLIPLPYADSLRVV